MENVVSVGLDLAPKTRGQGMPASFVSVDVIMSASCLHLLAGGKCNVSSVSQTLSSLGTLSARRVFTEDWKGRELWFFAMSMS